MTADELREIARRTDSLAAEKRAYMERTCKAINAGLTPYIDMQTLGMSQAEGDRSALLSLVRQVADLKPRFIHEQGDSCPWPPCGYPLAHPDHASNKACLWLIAQGAKP